MNKWLTILIAAVVAVTSVSPERTYAETELVASSDMPYITLLDEFTLYASNETKPNEAIGALSALQSVRLAPVESNRLMGITSMEKVAVETWLGEVWINLKEGSYKFGKLDFEKQTLTLLEEGTHLYDAPLKMTEYKLSPQKVYVIASISACEPYSPCQTYEKWYKWYLIETSWLGNMWIRPYHFAERYEGELVDGMIAIDRESEVFMYPFDKPIADEPKLSAQIIKPLGKYTRKERMVPPSVWYQVNTAKGIRWIQMDDFVGLGFEGIEKVDLKLEIPVPFSYFQLPSSYNGEISKQEPQIVHALGQRGDWYFVLTDGVGRWMNPAKEIATQLTGEWEHDVKLGVKQSNALLELTEATIALDIPYEDDSLQIEALTFTPQTVTASRVWNSPNGEAWYYIHTWLGAKWVRL
jgi:hypothetical protein